MPKGVIYIMTTAVPGLVKIGKTSTPNYEQRMHFLENNGYRNATGLKRAFAIEVDDYDEKETLLHTIFAKSQLSDTELFALDSDIAIQLLSAFEGKQIYPKNVSKENVFETAAEVTDSRTCIPDGNYTLNRKSKSWGKTIKGIMRVENGKIKVLKGSVCCPIIQNPEDRALFGTTAKRAEVEIVDDVLQEDVEFNSVSMAAQFLTYSTENGWFVWKTADKEVIDVFRKNKKNN